MDCTALSRLAVGWQCGSGHCDRCPISSSGRRASLPLPSIICPAIPPSPPLSLSRCSRTAPRVFFAFFPVNREWGSRYNDCSVFLSMATTGRHGPPSTPSSPWMGVSHCHYCENLWCLSPFICAFGIMAPHIGKHNTIQVDCSFAPLPHHHRSVLHCKTKFPRNTCETALPHRFACLSLSRHLVFPIVFTRRPTRTTTCSPSFLDRQFAHTGSTPFQPRWYPGPTTSVKVHSSAG